eukprot:1446800-Rhodomonas_salina.2
MRCTSGTSTSVGRAGQSPMVLRVSAYSSQCKRVCMVLLEKAYIDTNISTYSGRMVLPELTRASYLRSSVLSLSSPGTKPCYLPTRPFCTDSPPRYQAPPPAGS